MVDQVAAVGITIKWAVLETRQTLLHRKAMVAEAV
jgi:hypothetical protein